MVDRADEPRGTLGAINRDFYRDSAAAFSETRRNSWPGWEPLVGWIEDRLPPRVRERMPNYAEMRAAIDTQDARPLPGGDAALPEGERP